MRNPVGRQIFLGWGERSQQMNGLKDTCCQGNGPEKKVFLVWLGVNRTQSDSDDRLKGLGGHDRVIVADPNDFTE